MTDGGTCTGHTCDDSTLADPEGGQIILENMYLDSQLQAAFHLPAGVTTVNRISAFFENKRDPDANPFPMSGQCTNLATTGSWPSDYSTSHTDIDVGTVTLSGKNVAGADVSFDVEKQPAGTDAFGRPHDIFFQHVYPVAENYLKPDSAYAVKFAGSPAGAAVTIPATTLPNALYLSSTFQVSDPGHEDDGPLVAGTDYTVHWTPTPTPGLPTGDMEQVIVWLVTASGQPTHICPSPAAAGQFTIPGTAIAEYQAVAKALGQPTNQMIMLRNGVIHQVRRLPNNDPNNKRRIDMLTLNCWAQVMGVTAP